MDRLGAGTLLLCLYARARWSDLRYTDHVDLEFNSGYMTLYTAEHKTSKIGERREKFLLRDVRILEVGAECHL